MNAVCPKCHAAWRVKESADGHPDRCPKCGGVMPVPDPAPASARLIHDSAWAGSMHVLSIFCNLLRPEEERDAFNETYEALKACLEAYTLLLERERQRMWPEPSRN